MSDDLDFFEAIQQEDFSFKDEAPPPPPLDDIAEDLDELSEDEKERIRDNGRSYSEPNQGRDKEKVIGEAEIVVNVLNTFSRTACSMYSGKPRDNYGLQESEKKDLKEAIASYLETVESAPLSPGWMCALAVGMTLGTNAYKAYEDKKEVQRDKAEAATRKKAANATTEEEINEVKKEMEDLKAKEEDKPKEQLRNQFQVDANGFYQKTKDGVHIKGKKTEKAPLTVLNIIKKCKGMKTAEVNAKIREVLYGSPKPV